MSRQGSLYLTAVAIVITISVIGAGLVYLAFSSRPPGLSELRGRCIQQTRFLELESHVFIEEFRECWGLTHLGVPVKLFEG